MAVKFVQTKSGWINLDHVVRIRSTFVQGEKVYSLYGLPDGASGMFLGDVFDSTFQPAELNVAYVSALPNDFVWLVSVLTEDENSRPTEDDILCHQERVAAWKVVCDAYSIAQPVFIEPLCENEIVLIPMPDGRVVIPFFSEYKDILEAKITILSDAQSAWDEKYAPPAVPQREPEN